MCIVTTLEVRCWDKKRYARCRLATVLDESVSRACRGVHVTSLNQYLANMCDTTSSLFLLPKERLLVATGQEKCKPL